MIRTLIVGVVLVALSYALGALSMIGYAAWTLAHGVQP